jgi:hypothetical protein
VAQEQLARGEGDAPFLSAKVATARFYAEHILSRVPALRDAILEGGESVTALPVDAF